MVEKILKKIRTKRIVLGLSCENMALELAMSASAYHKLENNKTQLTVKRFLRIIEILDLPPAEIFELNPSDLSNPSAKSIDFY